MILNFDLIYHSIVNMPLAICNISPILNVRQEESKGPMYISESAYVVENVSLRNRCTQDWQTFTSTMITILISSVISNRSVKCYELCNW